jgi:glycerophosphoryl diester phosphodiesterase
VSTPEPAPLVIAHRGLASEFAPNSVAGLLAAADNGADAVELDLQLDDGQIVLSHESDPACREHEPEPARDFLSQEDGRYRKLFLEIKGTDQNRDALAAQLVALVDETDVAERVVLTSFHVDGLLAARRAADEQGLEGLEYGLKLLFDFGTSFEAGCSGTAASGSEADAYRHDFEWILWGATFIDRHDVEMAQAQGKRVATWSGETQPLIERALELEVDGIYTDAPSFLRARLR